MPVRKQVITDNYALYNGDSCSVLQEMASGSTHLSIYSPPFSEECYTNIHPIQQTCRTARIMTSSSRTTASLFASFTGLRCLVA